MKRFALVAAAILLASNGFAADLPKKALDVPAPPVTASPFYFGIWGGAGASTTENDLTLAGVSQGPVKAYPTGALAGLIAGYGTCAGAFCYGFTLEAAYDFSRGDVGFSAFNPATPGCAGSPNCAGPLGSIKNGLLLQEGVEIGISPTTFWGFIPTSGQPANWPVPITLPTSVYNNLMFMARGGVAERWVTLCALTDPTTGEQGCGSTAKIGPYAGFKLKAMLSANTEVFLKWDHIFWNSSFTPAAAAAFIDTFDTAMAKKEDIFGVGFGYHF